MIDCRFDALDRVLVRQALALSLERGLSVRLAGGAALADGDPALAVLLGGLEAVIGAAGLGRLARDGDDILYWPKGVTRNSMNLDAGPLAPATEVVLFLMPALFGRSFRCAVTIHGATHGGAAPPTSFLKECLLPALEPGGRYAGLALKRYGFYGSGGGTLEARVYPREGREERPPVPRGERRIVAGRVIFSGLDTATAGGQKEMLATGLGGAPVSILEVQDAEGRGNVVEVALDLGGVPAVVYRNIAVDAPEGGLAYDPGAAAAAIEELSAEARALVSGTGLPLTLARELAVYGIDAGGGAAPHPRVAETLSLHALFGG